MTTQDRFEELENRLGSKFAAVVYVSKLARQISEDFDHTILDSTAVTWAINGIDENYKREYVKATRVLHDSELNIMEDTISLVSDVEIQDCVRDSIRASLKRKNLVYVYNNIYQSGRQARVRVLTNVSWDAIMNARLEY